MKFLKEESFWREVSVNVFSGIFLAVITFAAARTPWVLDKLKTIAVQIGTASEDPRIVLPLIEIAYKKGDMRRVLALSRDIGDTALDDGTRKILELRAAALENADGSDTGIRYAARENGGASGAAAL